LAPARITALEHIAHQDRLTAVDDKATANGNTNAAHARLGPNNNWQAVATA
jgi:hypothetical protein